MEASAASEDTGWMCTLIVVHVKYPFHWFLNQPVSRTASRAALHRASCSYPASRWLLHGQIGAGEEGGQLPELVKLEKHPIFATWPPKIGKHPGALPISWRQVLVLVACRQVLGADIPTLGHFHPTIGLLVLMDLVLFMKLPVYELNPLVLF